MSDFKSLDHLGPIADEMLSGLHADDAMRLKIKQAAVLREENPEASLSELAELLQPQISKPAMSHRLKRITELAAEVTK